MELFTLADRRSWWGGGGALVIVIVIEKDFWSWERKWL
jgi:hypothetical protein